MAEDDRLAQEEQERLEQVKQRKMKEQERKARREKFNATDDTMARGQHLLERMKHQLTKEEHKTGQLMERSSTIKSKTGEAPSRV